MHIYNFIYSFVVYIYNFTYYLFVVYIYNFINYLLVICIYNFIFFVCVLCTVSSIILFPLIICLFDLLYVGYRYIIENSLIYIIKFIIKKTNIPLKKCYIQKF